MSLALPWRVPLRWRTVARITPRTMREKVYNLTRNIPARDVKPGDILIIVRITNIRTMEATTTEHLVTEVYELKGKVTIRSAEAAFLYYPTEQVQIADLPG